MNATCIGLDIAKQVFQVHGVDEHGHVVLRKTLKRKQVLTFFANLPFCLIGVEAGGGSHYWARELTRLGHEVKLIAPQFVAPYRKSGKAGKNDQNDAEAICEAVGRPNMRFVPIKSEEQQAVLTLRRGRELAVSERTVLVNQIWGLLGEFGVVVAPGRERFEKELPALLADLDNGLPVLARQTFTNLAVRLRGLNEIAKKHCGSQQFFKIGMEKLYTKIGTVAPLRKLRAQIKEIVEENHLPDYEITFSDYDIVTFTNRIRKLQATALFAKYNSHKGN